MTDHRESAWDSASLLPSEFNATVSGEDFAYWASRILGYTALTVTIVIAAGQMFFD